MRFRHIPQLQSYYLTQDFTKFTGHLKWSFGRNEKIHDKITSNGLSFQIFRVLFFNSFKLL